MAGSRIVTIVLGILVLGAVVALGSQCTALPASSGGGDPSRPTDGGATSDDRRPAASDDDDPGSATSTSTGTGDDAGDGVPPDATLITVELAGIPHELELAADPASRAQGLMGRTSIAPRGGMLFVFPDHQVRVQSFWMKNCLTDMDIAYLDRLGRITAMHEMTVEPPQGPDESLFAYELRLRGYSSVMPAQFAIELAPGRLAELGLVVGDTIELDLDDLKARAR